MHVTFPVLAVLIYRTLESLQSRKIEGPLHAYASPIHKGMNPKGNISRAYAAALRVCHSKLSLIYDSWLSIHLSHWCEGFASFTRYGAGGRADWIVPREQ